MNDSRAEEVQVIAAGLEEPARALLRAALVAQGQGRLDAAARVACDQFSKRPKALARAAILLAGMDAEWRLGGALSAGRLSEVELAGTRVGLFSFEGGRLEPQGLDLRLVVARGSRGLEAGAGVGVGRSLPGDDRRFAAGHAALRTLCRSLEDYLGERVAFPDPPAAGTWRSAELP